MESFLEWVGRNLVLCLGIGCVVVILLGVLEALVDVAFRTKSRTGKFFSRR